MDTKVLLGLLNNAALLLAMGLLYDVLGLRRNRSRLRAVAIGILMSVIGIAVMATPWHPAEGVNIDARSVLMGTSALFCGFIPTLIATVATMLFRWYQGGAGMVAGFWLIAGSSVIGLLWRRVRNYGDLDRSPGLLELYLLGVVVHLWMLFCLMIIPEGKNVMTIAQVGMPLMVIYPLGTMLLGMLLTHQRQRLQTNQALNRERGLLQQIIETSPVGILMTDAEGKFSLANSFARRILGLGSGPLDSCWLNAPDWRMTDTQGNPLDSEQLACNLVRSSGSAVYDLHHTISWNDGRQVQLSINAAPIKGDDGQLTGVVTSLEDITRRRRSEARIRKLNRVLTVLSNINQAIIRARDPMDMLAKACDIAVNDGGFRIVCAHLFDETGEKLKIAAHHSQNNCFETIAVSSGEMFDQLAQSAADLQQYIVVDNITSENSLNADMSKAFAMGIRCCGAFPLMVGGKVVGVLGLYSGQVDFFDEDEIKLLQELALDISFALEFAEHEIARRIAETGLKESEERYRSLFSDSMAIMMVIDPATGDIVDVNNAACEYYCWDAEQFKSMNIADINTLSPEQLDREMETAAEKRRSYFQFKHRRGNGEISDVEVYAGPVSIAGKTRLFSIIHDVSERVRVANERDQMQAQLRQSQKMEAVGRLAGGVAHDVNNMLTVILGYAENTLDSTSEDDESVDWVREIRSAAQRSASLIQQLLAFSRKQIVRPRVINFRDEIQRQAAMLSRMVGEDMHMEYINDENLWNVLMDPSQIGQILANLTVNARDAVRGVGTITIETANVKLDESYSRRDVYVEPGDYVMLAFSDTGEGMSSDTLEQVFEPFFTTKNEGEGTGLGLSTVYGIVKQNGGLIHAYSEVGMGTTFKIYLPRFEGEVDKLPEGDRNVPLKGDETILVVEDEDQILNLTKTMLRQYGYRVMTARTPAEACDAAIGYDDEIHLLLTDVVMPGMNGRQLQQEIKRIKPDIKALFMSGYTANVIAHRGVLDQDVNFIQKPFAMQALAAKVREVLDTPASDLQR